MGDYGTLLAAAIAALAGLAGYIFTQQIDRRERKMRFYADAVRAISEMEELPYRIRHRRDGEAETRAMISGEVTECFITLSFYMSWLRIDSPIVGEVYEIVALRAIHYGDSQREHAWACPPLTDTESALPEIYDHATIEAKRLCEKIMRQEIRFLSFLHRRKGWREIKQLDDDLRRNKREWVAPF